MAESTFEERKARLNGKEVDVVIERNENNVKIHVPVLNSATEIKE